MKFLIMVDIFSIFLFEQEIYCQDRFQKLSLLNKWIFLLKKSNIYFWNKLSNQIKKTENFKFKLDGFRQNG